MADELQISTCSKSWWCSSTGCGGDLQMSGSCSSPVCGDLGSNFGWSPSALTKARADHSRAGSFGNSPTASCITFQESQTLQLSDRIASMPAVETSPKLSVCHLSPPPPVDYWSQSFLDENPEMDPLKETSYDLFTDPSSSEPTMSNIPPFSSLRTPFLNSFLGDEARSSCPTHHEFLDILKSSQQINFLNADASLHSNENWAFCSSRPMQLTKSTGGLTPEEKLKSYIHTMKPDSEAVRKSSFAPVLKKPRIESLSPLPTLKVRKEKLCDRIAALQQLVSPFGKTDTASVLYEAIEYINFLHEQVRTLSSPYFPSGIQINNNQQNLERTKEGQNSQIQELRNRGLCLVPISSTSVVSCSEIPSIDFWVPPAFDLSYI
ncbi:Transcription factor bHLH123 [Platanthera guangdongensis]|uniref:Transcription factor bHLH123 n=1 Tax=Platanthera guangdongensis TaxID=2320717 RepID=A0ABR2MRC3_9ASPA